MDSDIRKNFPTLRQKVHDRELVYLDNPATTLKPEGVIEAVLKYYREETANVHRGIHFLSAQATAQYEQAREAVKTFINSEHSEEVIFTKGTTESINLVASSWGQKHLSPGDAILLTQMEHHSNIVPWQIVAQQTGAVVKVVPIDERGNLIQREYLRLLKEGVKITALAHASNTLGTVNPLEEMIPLAHSYDSLVLVDAAQSAPHRPIDVRKLDCDFLAFSGHKMYGPTGIGVLYGKRELLDGMPPYQSGGAMVEEVSFEKSLYQPSPQKFEAGTPPSPKHWGWQKPSATHKASPPPLCPWRKHCWKPPPGNSNEYRASGLWGRPTIKSAFYLLSFKATTPRTSA